MFDPVVIEALQFYVYGLRDPRNGDLFYVGKGQGCRCFEHVQEAERNHRETPKLRQIREILADGRAPHIDIIRHGMNEGTALEVEAALIDAFRLVDSGNTVRGVDVERGLATVQELQIRYGAQPLVTEEPLVLLKINRLYKPGMTTEELLHATRWCWRMNINRVRRANRVLAVAFGIVRAVFEPTEFARVTEAMTNTKKEVGRVYFNGHVVDSEYLNCSVAWPDEQGAANPVRYLNL